MAVRDAADVVQLAVRVANAVTNLTEVVTIVDLAIADWSTEKKMTWEMVAF